MASLRTDLADRAKLTLAAVLCLGAIVVGWRFLRNASGPSDRAFFYDLSEEKLFAGPRDAIPPIRGCNDLEEDGVRAVVISTNGNPTDRAARTIAYLERYSPELKRQMETARAEGRSPEMGRDAAQSHRFVRRLTDTNWYSLNTPEAEQIVTAWLSAGPDGGPALLCSP